MVGPNQSLLPAPRVLAADADRKNSQKLETANTALSGYRRAASSLKQTILHMRVHG